MSHIQALDKDCCCRWVRYGRTVVTNDIYPEEDAQFLVGFHAWSGDRILGVETAGCPHTAIREDASMNLAAIEQLDAKRMRVKK